MTASWTTWYLVFASLASAVTFAACALLALVVPVSAAVGFGSWMAGRPASRER